MPIPDSAEPSPDLASGDDGAWTVPGVSYLGLVAWYEERMPEGQDFDRWYWCDTGGGEGVSDDETVHSHIYARGARDILAMSIVDPLNPIETGLKLLFNGIATSHLLSAGRVAIRGDGIHGERQ